MTTDKEFIVAIELGSSAIRGIAGRKMADGSLQVLDIEQEFTAGCIRKGVIYNIEKTSQCLNHIIERIQEHVNAYISKVYIGIGGQSLRTVKNCVSRRLDTKMEITTELVESLKETNYNAIYADQEILSVAPQEYRVGSEDEAEPVGILADYIEGRYLNVVARTTLKENILKCVRSTGREVAGFFISPLILAENLLNDTEKRSGCALVDMGADTTTVAIFQKNMLRHLAVIPLGGNNITHDIASKQIEDEEAERLKLKYGTAYQEQPEENPKNINIGNDRTLDSNKLQEIVEARMHEILANVWEQINYSNYGDKLMGGIIFTGGVSNIENLDSAFVKYTHFDKLRTGRIIPCNTDNSTHEKLVKSGRLNTLIALLSKGELNCVGEDPTAEPEPEPETITAPADTEPINDGTAHAQQTATQQATEEHTVQTAETEKQPNKKKKEGRKWTTGFGQKLKDFFGQMVEE